MKKKPDLVKVGGQLCENSVDAVLGLSPVSVVLQLSLGAVLQEGEDWIHLTKRVLIQPRPALQFVCKIILGKINYEP